MTCTFITIAGAPTTHRRPQWLAALVVTVATQQGCDGSGVQSTDKTASSHDDTAKGDEPHTSDSGVGTTRHLAIVTERESPDAPLQYLHVLEDWPEDGKLTYDDAIELGSFVNVHAIGNSVFVHQPEDATVTRLVVNTDGTIDVGGSVTISFANYGVAGYAGDMVYASAERAYLLDESAGAFVTWDPETMEILGTSEVDEGTLQREGHAAQISRGIVLDGKGFVSASYRNWDTFEYYDTLAMGVFDATDIEPTLKVIEDDRCASSVTTPFDGGDGYVYLVSDAALGFDVLANPIKTLKTLCVLRMTPGSGEFDQDYLVDLGKVLESPGFYATHPMSDGHLLVNLWAPDVDVADVADPADPSWYWNLPPYFEYAIVDLKAGVSIPVKDLPRAAIQWSLTLMVDGQNYVQTYREDGGSELHNVATDGTVTRVLSNDAGVDVQYIARLAQ